ncbi:MAG: NADH dehydrogenase subunit, partial [Limisphaerales bacterium]
RPAPYSNQMVHPPQLIIPLKQNAGTPCQPAVRIGQQVQSGQPLGSPPKDALGAPIHTPLPGTVTDIQNNAITLQTNP